MLTRRSWLLSTALLALAGRAAASSLIELFGQRPARVERIFAAGAPAGVLLAVLAPEKLLGWPMTVTDAARPLLPPAARDKPVLGRLAGRGSTVSVESLLALKPDLIVDAGTVDGTYRSTAQRVAAQTGLPYALVDGRLAQSAAQLREVGELIGVSARARLLADHADEVLAETAVRRSPAPGVYLARGADGLETALAGSINGEIIEAAGGRNVAAGLGGIGRVSMEQVLDWAPDWVLTQDRNFFRRARSEPLWQAVPAVRAGRLLLAPNLPFGWIDGPPGINRLAGLRWLRNSLLKGEASPSGTIEEAQRFFSLFYTVTPPRAWFEAQLDGRD